MTAATLLGKLKRVRSTGQGRWMACCPAHPDKSPSLSVLELDDGTVLIKCFAGCGAADIVQSVGLSLADLFPQRAAQRGAVRHGFHPGDTLRLLEREARIIAIGASDIAQGRGLSPEDAERVALAAGRISDAVEVVYGRRH